MKTLLTAIALLAINFCSAQEADFSYFGKEKLPETDTLKVVLLVSETPKVEDPKANFIWARWDVKVGPAYLVRKLKKHVDEPGTACWNCKDRMVDDHFLGPGKGPLRTEIIVWQYRVINW